MIYSIKGTLTSVEYSLAVVECAGIGYACRTTFNSLAKMGKIGDDVFLYTYLHVREDALELFGFSDPDELNCFKMLISVSGVGPKAALSVLSELTPEKFVLAAASGDAKAFTKIKGIGLKTAQRIVLELKDKITKESLSFSTENEDGFVSVAASSNTAEAISALNVLGYSRSEAAAVIAGLDQSLESSELIKQALKKIGENKLNK